MSKIIFKFPIRVAVEFTGGYSANTNVWSFFVTHFLAPFNADFGREFSDIFIVFKIGPKFNLGTRFFT